MFVLGFEKQTPEGRWLLFCFTLLCLSPCKDIFLIYYWNAIKNHRQHNSTTNRYSNTFNTRIFSHSQTLYSDTGSFHRPHFGKYNVFLIEKKHIQNWTKMQSLMCSSGFRCFYYLFVSLPVSTWVSSSLWRVQWLWKCFWKLSVFPTFLARETGLWTERETERREWGWREVKVCRLEVSPGFLLQERIWDMRFHAERKVLRANSTILCSVK